MNYYGPKLKEHSHMSVEVMAHVLETGQIFSNRDLFLIKKTSLDISVNHSGPRGSNVCEIFI